MLDIKGKTVKEVLIQAAEDTEGLHRSEEFRNFVFDIYLGYSGIFEGDQLYQQASKQIGVDPVVYNKEMDTVSVRIMNDMYTSIGIHSNHVTCGKRLVDLPAEHVLLYLKKHYSEVMLKRCNNAIDYHNSELEKQKNYLTLESANWVKCVSDLKHIEEVLENVTSTNT